MKACMLACLSHRTWHRRQDIWRPWSLDCKPMLRRGFVLNFYLDIWHVLNGEKSGTEMEDQSSFQNLRRQVREMSKILASASLSGVTRSEDFWVKEACAFLNRCFGQPCNCSIFFLKTGITYRCGWHVDVKARLVNPLKNCKRKFLHWSIKCATWNLHSTSLAITWTGRSNLRRHHGVEISNSAIHPGQRTPPTPKMKRWGTSRTQMVLMFDIRPTDCPMAGCSKVSDKT